MRTVALLLCLVLATRSMLVVVSLRAGTDPVAYAKRHGLKRADDSEVGHLPEHVWAFHVDERKRETLVLDTDPKTEWHEIQEPRRRFTRFSNTPRLGGPRVLASDPLYGAQWHLHGNANSMGVEGAWSQDIFGQGVTVAIVDDGIQIRHPDLRVDPTLSRDYNNGRGTDCSPYTSDGHGTSAAGVCCAIRNNGQCGSGVAPQARLVGIRLIAEPTTDLKESQALSYKSHSDIDIYSNSWGPMDDAKTLAGPGRLTQMIFKQNAEQGRQGKGTIYVWAGGNGREQHDNCNYDGYANSIYTIAVGAIDHVGYQSWYSESGAALFVVAPSSGSGVGITTTDLTGRNGYAPGQCCNSFGGTSSAAPAVAGAIALLLQKRPELTWRDVQHVLASSSVQPAVSTGLKPNARGYTHSEQFGFGRVDVKHMLTVASAYSLVPENQLQRTLLNAEKTPHNGNMKPICTLVFTIGEDETLEFVEHITVRVQASHRNRGQLRITLTSGQNPGLVSTLYAPHSSDRHANVPSTHAFMSLRHWGESMPTGSTFTLQVEDTSHNALYGRGYVERVTLDIFGY